MRVIYPPTNIKRKTRSERLYSGKEMGERAEPMQWIVARHRQNSGERDEELGDPDTAARSRRGDVRGGGLASAGTFPPDYLCQTHIFRPHPR